MSNEKKSLDNFINVMSDFQFSINLEYDLFSDTKIKNYIPTQSAIEIIEDVMLSTAPKSTDRARIFVGAYGKGKSHLALMLLALLCRKEKELYNDLLTIICQTKPELCRYIVDYQNSAQKMLPVIIQGSSVGLRQSFLQGMKKALHLAGIDDLMPITYFSAAITTITTWKDVYPETYNKFQKEINIPMEDYVVQLANFDKDAYEQFVTIYPKLTSGSEFAPVAGMNIVELYEDVNKQLKNYGYSGIFIIYDEFSKFLSGNLKSTDADEIEILQYMAEACNRSASQQMHIMLISHQGILTYVDRLPKEKINSWKSVSQRYKPVELNTTAAQMYDLTAHVIKKNEEWFQSYLKQEQIKAIFQETENKWKGKKIFADLTPTQYQNLIYGCYPLDPITTFVLPEISEKIAQNERTLFTFLSAEGQRYTLPYYLKKIRTDRVSFVTPDCVYDYFESLFKADGYDRPTHKYWKAATAAINKLDDNQTLEKQIVKTLALVYIIDKSDILSPTVDTIINIYSGNANNSQSVISALTSLTNSGIIRKLDGKDFLKITEYTGKNVEALISDKTLARKSNLSIEKILNEFASNKVVYPNAYNDDMDIVRYFDFEFISAKKLLNNPDFKAHLTQASGDGIVYAVVANMTQLLEIENVMRGCQEKRIIFAVSNFEVDIYDAVARYDAINDLVQEHATDDVLIEELSYSLTALEELLSKYVDSYLRPELGQANYYVNGNLQTIKRRSALSKIISQICNEEFCDCPVINNEVINKNNLTGQAINSRRKIITGLLANSLLPELGLSGSGQEVSFMKSTLCSTGILKTNDDSVVLDLNPDNSKLAHVLEIIKTFLVETSISGKKNLSELYKILTVPENHIGLKRGIIPIYFAVILHYYKKYCVVMRNGQEVEIDARLLDAINENPEGFDIFLENWDAEKDIYVQNLESIFAAYVDVSEKEYNSFSYIARGMQRWYLQLPKYVKNIRNIYTGHGETTPCEKSFVKLLNALRSPEINARDLLFAKLLWVFDEKEFNANLAIYVQNAKKAIDNIKPNLIQTLKCDLVSIFSTGKTNRAASLSSIVMDWVASLTDETKSHMFNASENGVLSTCINITPDEAKFIEDLARITTGLRIDDWAEITIDGFYKAVENFKSTVDNYNINSQSSDSNGVGSYKIIFTDETGTQHCRTFDKSEYTHSAELMYNDVAAMLEEYGGALSDGEKRQVLMDIINKLLG